MPDFDKDTEQVIRAIRHAEMLAAERRKPMAVCVDECGAIRVSSLRRVVTSNELRILEIVTHG